MAFFLNKTQAAISFPGGITLVPGQLTDIPAEKAKELEKYPLWKRSIDNGGIVSGPQAKKIADDAKKDMEDREKKEKPAEK